MIIYIYFTFTASGFTNNSSVCSTTKKATSTDLPQSPLYTPENEQAYPNNIQQHVDITDHSAPSSQHSILTSKKIIIY